MAYGYRSRRRSYRRGYRRYRRYGSSVRRYRSVQMNDNETKVMTFTSVTVGTVPVGLSNILYIPFTNLLNGASNNPRFEPSAGRLFFAGMMFDRFRIRSLACTIRPRVMPSSSATNYTLYASWDRYGGISPAPTAAQGTGYSIQSDPSAKQITWCAGGSGSALRTYIYATSKDRYQYLPIFHESSLVAWQTAPPGEVTTVTSSPFYPVLMLAIDAITAPENNPSVSILARVTIEFQGGFSSTSLNYTPSAASLSLREKVDTEYDYIRSKIAERVSRQDEYFLTTQAKKEILSHFPEDIRRKYCPEEDKEACDLIDDELPMHAAGELSQSCD